MRLSSLPVSPPDPRPHLAFPLALALLYPTLMQIEGALADAGLSAFVMAVVLAIAVAWIWRMPAITRGVTRADLADGSLPIAFGLFFCALAILLLGDRPVWVQRFFSLTTALQAALLVHALIWRRDRLEEFHDQPDADPHFLRHWARWRLPFLFALVAVNEWIIAQGTQGTWVALWCLAPLLVYAMTWRSLIIASRNGAT